MGMIRTMLASFLVALLLCAPGHADTIYVSDRYAALHAFDTATGTFSLIGNTGLQMPDIAIDSTGTLLGASGSGNTLWAINTSTAAKVLRGPISGRQLNSLAFDASDTLFGADRNGGLYDVNPANGVASLIGNTPLPAGDLAFDESGTLFMTTYDNKLVRLDPTTGASTLIGNMGAIGVWGLAFDSAGTLWGFTRPGLVYTINTTTGLATFQQDSGIQAYGAASDPFGGGSGPGPVPEPGTWVLMSGGLLWVLARRRRRNG